MPDTEIAPRRGKSKKNILHHELRMEVLEYLDRGGEVEDCRRKFGLTRGDILKVIRGRAVRIKSGGRAAELAGVVNEHRIRTRLFDRAVEAVEDSLDPLERAIKKSTLLSQQRGLEFLSTAVAHLRNRGQNAIKVLEGIGDFRRGGDELPKEARRQPMFNLPPGAHVAVTLDITTQGETNASIDGRTIEAERLPETEGTEGVQTEIQEGETSGGDREDHGILS